MAQYPIHTTPTATIERLNPGRRRGRLWCKLATIDGDLMDSPASGRGAYGYHERVGAPYGGRHASPRPSDGGSREYMEKIDSIVGKLVVSPYKAGGGLRRARGRRGCARGLQCARGCRGHRSKSGDQEDTQRESSRGPRGGQKGWRTASRSQWHFRARRVRRGGHRAAIHDHRQVRVLAKHRAIQQAVGCAHGNRVQCGEECCAAPCGGVLHSLICHRHRARRSRPGVR